MMLKYQMKNGTTNYEDQKRNTVFVANFEARIIEELRYIDDAKVTRHYVIEGKQLLNPGGADKDNEYLILPIATIAADDFHTMSWVTPHWGSQAIIYPSASAKEILRTCIQMESKPVVRSIYTATGWVKIDGKPHFLTSGAAVHAHGRRNDIMVELPAELKCYALPPQTTPQEIKAAVRASLALSAVAPPEIAWLLLAACYRSVIGPSDFAIHVTGRTGTFKSELASLIQSHFGPVTARHLPAAWSSTGNALESLAYRARNVIMVIDDFIPTGTSWQIKSYQKTADQIIRAQGNQAGRARLTDTSRLQVTMYPRGLILSTGEDTPEGHSVRGRMMIAEMTPGDISTERLTKAQQSRALYAHAMADFIRWLAIDLKGRREHAERIHVEVRDANLKLGHSRTPSALGHLMAGVCLFLLYATEEGHIPPADAEKLYANAEAALQSLAGRQIEYLQSADPAEQFIQLLRGIFAANAGHLKGMHGGIPRKAQVLGWTSTGDGPNAEWKPHGPRLGWSDDQTGTAYLEATVAYDTIRRHSRGAITITRQTLYKRLREAGHLKKYDEARQRNTIRMTCENAGRTVLALSLNALTDGDDRNHD
jgi:hypothetical protein